MEYNPQLVVDYLNNGEELPLLLTYNPSEPVMLDNKTRYQLVLKLWWLIISLQPPREYQETTAYVHDYIARLKDGVRKVEAQINIASIRQFDGNEE